MSESPDDIIAITFPRDGLPEVVDTHSALTDAITQLQAGSGPLAVDAERASGFKFSQRAYLIQLRRQGAGTFLIDPTAFENLETLQAATADMDWILHAATQDLVCLDEVGLRPAAALFDTELAGRLLGRPRVGLATLLEEELGIRLAKEHSAADWSTRPLPESWLVYAALDVEYLDELWESLKAKLIELDKIEWAYQEFAHVQHNTKRPIRVEPWRRTSGLHVIKKPRELAIVRELWNARNDLAEGIDLAPGRLLPDSAIVNLATRDFSAQGSLDDIPEFKSRGARKFKNELIAALHHALSMSAQDYPEPKLPASGPPAPRNWQMRNPEAFARLEYARSKIAELAEKLQLPSENLISPDVVRRMMWEPPADCVEFLTQHHVRPWQQEIVLSALLEAIEAH